ncbi:glutathione S-transferase family protein [Paracraurococcus ruber]|uniref:Glutathione S-transferase n=1 Tax=Paracraurococcus ruber TaxID=77675 RepID=A0ABS1CXB4_9PROT|nr:glutathione S-transferase [Paracraurococcus ruber]MBK1659175.1 glutathione S-transferase [Paracraurococcus ruber]TDG29234.1 glutathione S-transferase [Paracraurococcus ruber]
MIVLHHCFDARSFRPLWTLEEMGLPYRLRLLPFPPREAVPDYLAVNPLGTIPLLEDGAVRMNESAAICHYLVSRYGPSPLNVAPEEPDYAAFLNGLHFGEATLTFPQTLLLRYRRLEPPERRLPQVAEDYERWFLSRLRKGLARLDGGFYAAGRFTAADISIGYALLLATRLGLAGQFTPDVADYWARLSSRPGYLRAQGAQQAAQAAQAAPPADAPG